MLTKNTGARILSIGIGAWLLCACNTKPPDALGRGAFEQYVTTKGTECTFKVTTFEKTDGVSSTQDGVPHFLMDFTSEVVPEKDCCTDKYYLDFHAADRKTPFGNCTGSRDEPKIAKAGTSVKFSGKVSFLKKDSGWTIDPNFENHGVTAKTQGW